MRIEEIRVRSENFLSKKWNTNQDAINCANDILYLLSEVDRLTAELEQYRQRGAELKQWIASKIEMLDKRIEIRNEANCFDEFSAILRFNNIAGAYESVLEHIEHPESYQEK